MSLSGRMTEKSDGWSWDFLLIIQWAFGVSLLVTSRGSPQSTSPAPRAQPACPKREAVIALGSLHQRSGRVLPPHRSVVP